MDRTPFLETFSRDRVPDWRCPSCSSGHLTLPEENLKDIDSKASRDAQQHEASEFDWIRSRTTAMFVCSRCTDSIACAAEGSVEEDYTEDERGDLERIYVTVFSPKFFFPALKLMDIPEDCPESVVDHLETSFSMYFANPSAAANSARIAVEALLDEWKVPKLKNQSLHHRIQSLQPPHDAQKELLLAVKWLGNDGSHAGEAPLDKEAVNGLYDILELALEDAYGAKRKAEVRARANALNAQRAKK